MNTRGTSGTTRRVGEEKREMEGIGRIYIDLNYSPSPRLCLPQHRLSPRHFPPFNSFPLRVSRHPHIQSWFMFPLSHPPPQLVYPSPYSLSSPFPLLSSPGHKFTPCHLISDALTPPHEMLPITSSQIPRSIQIYPRSHLASKFTSTQLTSPRLPSSPHWIGRTTHHPCAYSRLPPVPRASSVPFHGHPARFSSDLPDNI